MKLIYIFLCLFIVLIIITFLTTKKTKESFYNSSTSTTKTTETSTTKTTETSTTNNTNNQQLTPPPIPKIGTLTNSKQGLSLMTQYVNKVIDYINTQIQSDSKLNYCDLKNPKKNPKPLTVIDPGTTNKLVIPMCIKITIAPKNATTGGAFQQDTNIINLPVWDNIKKGWTKNAQSLNLDFNTNRRILVYFYVWIYIST